MVWTLAVVRELTPWLLLLKKMRTWTLTREVIQKIANSINPMVKLTIDTPCNYEDGKLPVLDVKVDVNEKEDNRIDLEFFEKPTKNPRVILASYALSHSQKWTIMTQECLRRLQNIKVELGPEVQRKI